MQQYKTIGILGGMGPEATAEFYLRIIKLFQKRKGAKFNSDFPEMIIDSIPLPAHNVAPSSTDKNEVIELLKQSCQKLEQAGAEFIVIPCNTVHEHIAEMRLSVSVSVESILEATAMCVKKEGRKPLILGTSTTRHLRLYEKTLQEQGIDSDALKDHEQKVVDEILMRVVSGKGNSKDGQKIKQLIERYKKDCDAIILGCTEIPLVFNQAHTTLKVFDTLDVLADHAYNKSTN
jgi:aspartate racemase